MRPVAFHPEVIGPPSGEGVNDCRRKTPRVGHRGIAKGMVGRLKYKWICDPRSTPVRNGVAWEVAGRCRVEVTCERAQAGGTRRKYHAQA